MKGCLAIAIAVTFVSGPLTVVAGRKSQNQGVLRAELGLGSIENPFDPLGISSDQKLMNQFSSNKIAVPEQFKHNETVFAMDNEEEDEQAGSDTPAPVKLGPILGPVSTNSPPKMFERQTHVVRPVHLRTYESTKALPTNKFYENLILGDSHAPIWTHPFGLRWDSRGPMQQGLGISHIDDSMKSFGPTEEIRHIEEKTGKDSDEGDDFHKERTRFYLNPFLVSMGFSAAELDERHDMTVGDFGEFGCTMLLVPFEEMKRGKLNVPRASIRVPIVRGMAFVTALYKNMTPQIFSNILVRTLSQDSKSSPNGWVKYRFLIEDGNTWLLYAKPELNSSPPLVLEKTSSGLVTATSGKFTGQIQIAKLPIGNEAEAEAIYDKAAGVYPTGGELIIEPKYLNGESGGYKINWELGGTNKMNFIHFTLPHHRHILTDVTKPTSIVLASTTKGKMVAYQGSSWHLYEPERLKVDFLPENWSKLVTQEQLATTREQATKDVELDFDRHTDLDSMYFAGKGLAKLSLVCLVITDVLNDNGELQVKCLDKLKASYSRFLENRQMFPLVYDRTWKGLISVQGLKIGPQADFGNSWYNDHHYHYGYFIHTAAIIRHLDPTWRTKEMASFTNSLIRDVANPSSEDTHFPVFRSFDWFMGHSWSQGIFVSLDGKDEESTSEDINLSYAISLWSKVAMMPEMERLSQLMLTIVRRSVQSYFLMEDDNENHPPLFVGNKVTECIQGIQMIPATPALSVLRRPKFVKEEWDTLLYNRIDQIDDGWKSILMTNYAAIDKGGAWKYFTSGDNIKPVPLDDGMTLTWALFYVASQPYFSND
ncbi:hypothetical protein BGZ76_000273 [Entomortierella beljakovae]|nr:hypothetical protein BGZ76_000273 [Entomortierella beljakovae]